MKRLFAAVFAIASIIIIIVIFISGCVTKQAQDWAVTSEGMLKYPKCTPEYQLTTLETADNYTLYKVTF